ncbi:alpha/beta fold hydrolase [Salininema proteolyticum]|uniref:Alpha/beta fold hydrolase n=1 Tax=Salininema proteolyticum TaxID=1607685 RepID=A0ABV8TYW4_9ACTN
MSSRGGGPLPRLRKSKRAMAAAVGAIAVAAGAAIWTAGWDPGGSEADVDRTDQVIAMPGADIDTSYYSAGSDGKRPAVLLAHGFGGSKDNVASEAESLAAEGYAVLTWSARGFGESTGAIGLNDPEAEVADVSRLLDWLSERPEVMLDAEGDPRAGIAGGSYGGAVALLAAGHDDRVDAIAPRITYWNLADALFPEGVFKKLWAGMFVTSGGGCQAFQDEICRMYERVAESGRPDGEARALLEERSPSAVGDEIDVPTYFVQGRRDSLFPLSQADEAVRQIEANGAPVRTDWISGGHDGGDMENERVDRRTAAFFDRHLKGDESADTGPAFRVSGDRRIDAAEDAEIAGAVADSYPGLDGTEQLSLPLSGEAQPFANPPGGSPSSLSAIPGLGEAGDFSALPGGLSVDFPGQFARFETEPLDRAVRITGSPEAEVTLGSSSGEAVVFAKLYDVGPDGTASLTVQQVTPVRAPDGETVSIRLPALDEEVRAGHRLRLVLSSTDLGFATPAPAAEYSAEAVGDLTVPTVPELTETAAPLPVWVWALPAAALAAAVLLLVRRRRTTHPAPDPDLADVPLQITGLSKRYKGGDAYSVKDLSFRVERGQVLGLLGPNGAGKTTTLRMLMGLIRPDAGEIRLFGHAVRPGAPVLSRVGSFVEGAGFLPHLSGRQNLDLYWKSTGRPAADSRMDEALDIAGLGDAVDRAVRTYSQGMRQRLAIAQAMLGLPDLLILDEPTNGLDPPQIREMREVMIRYADRGRTVIVSSHLLSEVEQSCTDLVVMDRGRLVQAGPVGEIAGDGDTLFVGVDGEVGDDVVAKVAALEGVASAEPAEGGLSVRLDGASASDLNAELVRLDVPVSSLGPHRRLEDAFLTLISDGAAV